MGFIKTSDNAFNIILFYMNKKFKKFKMKVSIHRKGIYEPATLKNNLKIHLELFFIININYV